MKTIKRLTKTNIILIVLFITTVIVLSAVLLQDHTSQSTNLSKEHFITISMSGVNVDGSIRPGGSVSVAPVVSNEGDTNAYAFIQLSGATDLYTFTADSGWYEIEDNVWAYGSADALTVLSPMESTSALTNSMTMIDMNGDAFQAVSDVNVTVDGYLIETTAGEDPADVWSVVSGG